MVGLDGVLQAAPGWSRADHQDQRQAGEEEVEQDQLRGAARTSPRSRPPGILPALFGRHVMGNSVFTALSGMAKNLPKLTEQTYEHDMDDDLAEAVEQINEELVPVACEMAAMGNIQLLGMMLEVLSTTQTIRSAGARSATTTPRLGTTSR